MEYNIISVGIFFDGTGNNGINATSQIKPPENNQSYYSNITNIFKLFGLFNGNEKLYVEGIGTVTGAEDSDFAMATCKNPYGYTGYSAEDKMNQAIDFINDIMQDKIHEYHFYVYGFSRGAMLARAFCNELLRPGCKIYGNVKIKFLGVFDTVESAPLNDFNVAVSHHVERALHLCAINECRYFFPLTGFFENSRNMQDAKVESDSFVWKEIFIPGAHADVGGGYLEGSQSVYISANFMIEKDLDAYVSNVKNTATDAQGNKIWSSLLSGYRVDSGEVFSQAYVARDMVYNDLSKVYGKLMLMETNSEKRVFNTDFNDSNFEINAGNHMFLITFYNQLERYTKDLSPILKPAYDYGKFADYTHISANFGLHQNALSITSPTVNVEIINNGLNVPGNKNANRLNTAYASSENDLNESIIDYAYGSNIPNNDNWSRSILIKENFYNKC